MKLLGDPPKGGVCQDTDNDLINDVSDNCVLTPNVHQFDPDGDGYGEPFGDEGGCDNCLNNYNPDQLDHDRDGVGNVCDPVACEDPVYENATLTLDLFCTEYGLTILEDDVTLDCAKHRITGSGSFTGISLDGANNAVVKSCVIEDFSTGISLTNSNDNLIFNNYFNNTINAVDDGTNNWNLPVKQLLWWNIIGDSWWGGNFWHDYTGLDINGDGIGDTELPYNSNGNIQNGGDVLPLVKVRSPVKNIAPITATARHPMKYKFRPLESNYVDESNPNTVMCPDCEYITFRHIQQNGIEIYGLMKFNISNIPASRSVVSATLYYYVIDGLNDPRSFQIFSVPDSDDEWQEATVTWDTRPAKESVRAEETFVPTENKWYTLDITAYITEEHSSRNRIVTLLFSTPSNGPFNQWRVETEEGSHKPLLIVKTRR